MRASVVDMLMLKSRPDGRHRHLQSGLRTTRGSTGAGRRAGMPTARSGRRSET